MSLYFVTGNEGKFAEVQALLPSVQQIDIDLEEIQEIDPQIVVQHKLLNAFEHQEGEFIVEDTSLYIDGLNGLPGPLIKWFLKAIGIDGLAQLAQQTNNIKATAKTIVGYARNREEMYFFEGETKGMIVPSRGILGFGWDSIFQPDGQTDGQENVQANGAKTFAEMTMDEKQHFSMRKKAVLQLKEFMESK